MNHAVIELSCASARRWTSASVKWILSTLLCTCMITSVYVHAVRRLTSFQGCQLCRRICHLDLSSPGVHWRSRAYVHRHITHDILTIRREAEVLLALQGCLPTCSRFLSEPPSLILWQCSNTKGWILATNSFSVNLHARLLRHFRCVNTKLSI